MFLGSLCMFIIKTFGQSSIIQSFRRRWRNVSLFAGSTGVASPHLSGHGYARDRDKTFPVIDSFSESRIYSDRGAVRLDALVLMDQGGIDSCRASAQMLRNSFSSESEEVDYGYRMSQEKIRETMGTLNEIGSHTPLAEVESSDHNMEGDLQVESDSLEEWEGIVQIRMMVVEAVWKGKVRAVEHAALKAVEIREEELLKLKQELQSKDSIISDLVQSLKNKDHDVDKVEESGHLEIHDEAKESKDVVTLYRPNGENTSLDLLQGQVELLNCKIQEMTSTHSILIQEIGNYKAKTENQHTQIVKQESILHDTERRCQILLVVSKCLRDRIAGLSSKLLEYEDAAQLTREEVQEQNWKHEAEMMVVMTTLDGRVMDIQTELSHFGEDMSTNRVETVTAKSQLLHGLLSELQNLLSSKASLESRSQDTQAAVRFLETYMSTEQQNLADKANELKYVERRLTLLENKLLENEGLLRNLQINVADMKNSGEYIEEKKAAKVVDDFLAGDHRKSLHSDPHLETLVESLEENVWLINTEKMFISSYMENAFQVFQRITLEIMSALKGKDRFLESLHGPHGANVGRPWVKKEISSDSEKRPQSDQGMRTNIQQFTKPQAGPTDKMSESEEPKGDVGEEHSKFKELEEILSLKEGKITKLQEAMEESNWQSQVEKLLILGFAEGLCQQMKEIRQQLEKNSLDARNAVEEKSMYVGVLEKEVSESRNQIKVLESELSSVNSHMKVRLEGQLQTTMTTMQLLEGNITGKVEEFDLRVQQAHDKLQQMRTGFEGQVQTVTVSVQQLEGDLAGKVEQFDSRLQQAHDTLQQMKTGFEGQVQTVTASVQRLERDLAGKVEQFDSRLEQAHDTLQQMKTRFDGQVETLMGPVQGLEEELAQNVEQFDSRLQHAHYTFKQLSHQLRASEAQYVHMFHDLQKAETEVDYLGDEVDALMELLEKVHTVLSHYYPVIQLYPGLADLCKEVRQEVLQCVCDSDVV